MGEPFEYTMYIAKPPHCEFEVFGVSGGERYNTYNLSDVHFISQHVINTETAGWKIYVYEIDFIDHQNGTKETRKNEVYFKVIDYL